MSVQVLNSNMDINKIKKCEHLLNLTKRQRRNDMLGDVSLKCDMVVEIFEPDLVKVEKYKTILKNVK